MVKLRVLSLLVLVVLSTPSVIGQDIPLPQDAESATRIIEDGLKALMTPGPKLVASLEAAHAAVDKQRDTAGPDSPELILLLVKRADLESKVNERAKAVETHREALRIAEKNFGQQHHRTRSARVEVEVAERVSRLTDAQFIELQRARAKITGVHFLGKNFSDTDRAQLIAEAHETMRELCGVGSRDCENAHKLRCNQALAARQLQEVVRLIDRDIAELKQLLGPDHPDYTKPLLMRSLAQVSLKDFGAAESGFREVDSLQMKSPDANLHDRSDTLLGLTSLLIQAGRLEEAEETAQRLVEVAERNSAADRLRFADALGLKGGVALLQNKDDLAIQCLLQAIEIESSPEGRPLKLALLQQNLGTRYVKQKRWAEAEPLLRSSSQIFEKLAGPTDDRTLMSASGLATTYLYTERWAEAETLLKRTHHRTISRSGRDSDESRTIRDARVKALRAQGKDAEADELLREPRPFIEKAAGASN